MAQGTPNHPYHILPPSPWPIASSFAALLLVIGFLMFMRDATGGPVVLFLGLAAVIATMIGWWRDVLKESKEGDHNAVVAKGLRVGMALFIASEVFFFLAWFWAWFWGATGPNEALGGVWPPEGIEPAHTFGLPFFNTLLLLLSGCTLTWAHHSIVEGNQKEALHGLVYTVILGFVFLGFQAYEYAELTFGLSDTMYGSTFYMATGFHGFHVFVGAVFLTIIMIRAYQLAIKPEKHVGFEAAAWYWHFVDVVWLFLFVVVYWWGSAGTH